MTARTRAITIPLKALNVVTRDRSKTILSTTSKPPMAVRRRKFIIQCEGLLLLNEGAVIQRTLNKCYSELWDHIKYYENPICYIRENGLRSYAWIMVLKKPYRTRQGQSILHKTCQTAQALAKQRNLPFAQRHQPSLDTLDVTVTIPGTKAVITITIEVVASNVPMIIWLPTALIWSWSVRKTTGIIHYKTGTATSSTTNLHRAWIFATATRSYPQALSTSRPG